MTVASRARLQQARARSMQRRLFESMKTDPGQWGVIRHGPLREALEYTARPEQGSIPRTARRH